MTMAKARPFLAIALFALAYGAAILLFDNAYHRLIITLVPIWAVLGLSWNLFSGYSGLISFGHAAFFGLGAYLVAIGAAQWGLSPWLGIPLAGGLGGLAGLLIGLPTFRLRGHYFALAMLAYPLALLSIFDWLGYQELTLPRRQDAPIAFMQFAGTHVLPLLSLALLVAAMLLTRWLERSPMHLALLAIKQDEAAAEASGINTRALKLKAMMMSGAMAGVAGGFYAVVLLVVTPGAVFGMLVSAQALTVAMFGGVGTLWGPVIGALVLVPMGELLQARLGDVIPGIQGVIYGVAIIAVILLAPNGLYWKLRGRPAIRVLTPRPGALALSPPDRGTDILVVEDVSRFFGGVQAVSGVSITVRAGEVLGIIGPNGAGKTTVFNLLNGFQKPDGGHIRFMGRRIDGLRPSAICRAGIGRTFQVVKPFPGMSVLDNVTVGGLGAAGAEGKAWAALEMVGLEDIAGRPADSLTSRQLRLMELARALAGEPRLILMDEPLAGLGAGETEELVAVVRRLAATGLTIVIIEHTMQAMVRLADRFLVLDHGRVLAEGAPEAVTRDPRVIEAYLGRKWMDHAAG